MNTYLVEVICRLLRPFARTRPGPSLPSDLPSQVLVIKPASLGDVLMATPFLAALRAHAPQAHITVMVSTWAKPALERNLHVDEIFDCGSVGFPGRYGVRDYLRCVMELRRRGFSHAFVLDRSPLMALLPRLAGVPWRAGLDSRGRGVGLHVGVLCPSDRHEAEIYLDVLRACGIVPEKPRLHFQPGLAAETFAQHLFAEWHLNGKFPVMAVHPGGGANPGQVRVEKRWGSANFAMLADRLSRELGATVVLVGGPQDAPTAALVAQRVQVPVVNLTGQLTLSQLAAVLHRCHLYVGNDSAPMHLAAAMGVPVVALFGPTPPERYGPYGVHHAVVRFRASQADVPNERELESAWAAVQRLLHLRSLYEQANL